MPVDEPRIQPRVENESQTRRPVTVKNAVIDDLFGHEPAGYTSYWLDIDDLLESVAFSIDDDYKGSLD